MRLVLISPLETTSSILCSSTKIFSSHYIPTILVWNKKCCGIISTVFKCTIGLQLRYLRVDPTLGVCLDRTYFAELKTYC